jgi:hypothetical protein
VRDHASIEKLVSVVAARRHPKQRYAPGLPMTAAYLALGKLTGPGKVQVAARHNLREIQAELGADSHIDAARSHLNLVLAGPDQAAGVGALAERLMGEAGVPKLRKDAVRAIELVISLPPDTGIDTTEFFRCALEWVRHFFGVPVLSAVVHYDEQAPHAHVIVLPLMNGRMVGSDLMGGPSRLRTIQADFHSRVSSRYGLSRPSQPKRLSAALREAATQTAIDRLLADPECLRKPAVRTALTRMVATNYGDNRTDRQAEARANICGNHEQAREARANRNAKAYRVCSYPESYRVP